MRMAGRRTNPDSPAKLGLAVLFGAIVLADSIALGQLPQAGPMPQTGAAQSSESVVELRVVGNTRTDTKKILAQIRTRAGRPFNSEVIEEDVRRLYKTGWFVTVRPQTQSLPQGRVVIFEVLERPLIQHVWYVGCKSIVKQKLAKEAEIKAGDALNLFAVEEARRRVEDYYHSHGFPNARVTLVEGDKASDAGVTFLINEGTKQRIWHTEFIGNTIASDDRLKTQIQSKPGFFWLFGGEVKRQELDEDVNRLTSYYRGLGFFRARVGRYLEYDEDNEWLTLTFVIDEGPRYAVRNVSFIGNKKFATDELSQMLAMQSGAYFNQAEMQHDVSMIRDKYGSIGYIFADVKADPRFLEEPGQLDLVYDIREGYRCRVGKIVPQIEGELPHTRISVILNRLSIKPGDIVDIRELRASERRLQASRLFEVDPRMGVTPKIVFSPPDAEDMDGVQQASHEQGYRGQNPSPHAAWRPPVAADYSPEDRVVNLAVQGSFNGDVEQLERQYQFDQEQQQQQQPPPAPAGPPPSDRESQATEPMIFRGQFSSDAGQSVPTLNRTPYTYPYSTTPYAASRSPSSTTQSYTASSTSLPSYAAPGSPPPIARYAQVPPGQLPPPERIPPGTGLYPGMAAPDPDYGGPGLMDDGTPMLDDPLLDEEPPRYIPLNPIVQETRTGRFMLSVGVNSDAGLLGSVIVDEQNFDLMRFPRSWQDVRDGYAWRGAGQRFRMEAVPGTEVQKYTIDFQEPYLLNTRVSLGTSGFFYNRRYVEWSEERIGGRVAFGYQLTPDLSGVLAYRGMKVTVYDPIVTGLPELDEVIGGNALHGFEVRLSHDTRDNAFLPTQGHLIEFSFEQVLGTYQYPRSELDIRRYFMLHQRPDGSGRHVLSLSGRAAYTGSDTPIYEHYYAGGFSTLRGFDFRGASPRDPVYNVSVGGEFMLLASAEYMFPITADDAIRGVVFCDTGTVEPTIDDWSDKYRVAPGFGLRITIPAMGPAPIALDFGFPIVKNPGDDEEVFSFFVGFLR